MKEIIERQKQNLDQEKREMADNKKKMDNFLLNFQREFEDFRRFRELERQGLDGDSKDFGMLTQVQRNVGNQSNNSLMQQREPNSSQKEIIHVTASYQNS